MFRILFYSHYCIKHYPTYTGQCFSSTLTQYYRKYSLNTGTVKENYDIIIVGGGMVGLAAACALGHSTKLQDRRLLLLEKRNLRKFEAGEEFSNRVSALTAETTSFLARYEAWGYILNHRYGEARKMHVWESFSDAKITFENPDQSPFAYIVENNLIMESLRHHLPKNIQVEYGVQISKYDLPNSEASRPVIHLVDDTELTCDLLIGADGFNSAVRKAMGSKYFSYNYDQVAVVATLKLAETYKNDVAWQRFVSHGPVALLPLSNDTSSLVWSTTKAEAKRLLEMSELEFTDALNNEIWENGRSSPFVNDVLKTLSDIFSAISPKVEVGDVERLPPSIVGTVNGSRAGFPLGQGHAYHYVAPRVALIGDAAHRVHPLAGQGVNLGFGDVQCLCANVEEAVMLGEDLGVEDHLYRYESERQRYNLAMIAAIDGIYRIYTCNALPVVLMRSLGLSAVNSIGFLKEKIMQYAGS